MSVVDREALKEALEKRMLHQRHHVEVPHDELELFTAAARSVLEGEATKWCENHNVSAKRSDLCWGASDSYARGAVPAPCRMVRVVVVPIGGTDV